MRDMRKRDKRQCMQEREIGERDLPISHLKMEVLDPNSVIPDDLVLVYTPGLNAYFGKYVRLMVHGNIQRVSKHTEESFAGNVRSREELILQFCFDI